MNNMVEFAAKTYLKHLEKYCQILSFEQIPKAGDLIFHRINLENIFLPIDIVKRDFTDINFSDVDVDELLRKIDEKIALLEAQEEAEKNGTPLINDSKNTPINFEDCNEVVDHTDNSYGRVIISEPGSGKTTFCKRVCMSYISNDESIHKKYELPEIAFPVLLLCRSLGDDYKQYTDFYQLAYNMTVRTFSDFDIPFDTFKQLMKKKEQDGELLLLVDGIDELLDEEKAKYFSDKLCEYAKQVFDENLVKFILTIRVASWTQQSEIKTLLNPIEYTISKLTDNQVLEFCRKWYAAVFPQNPEKQKNVADIYKQLINPSSGFSFLNKLKTNPLQLSNLLIVSRYSGKMPSTKNKLYEEYLDLVLAWNTQINSEDIKIQLAYIASYMTKNNLNRIDEETLVETLKKCYEDLEGRFSAKMNPNGIGRILREFEERNCVLQRTAIGYPFEFTHRQLQEYLTMYAILNGYSDTADNEKYPIEILRQYYEKKEWREVIEMSALTNDSRLTHNLVSDIISKIEEHEKNGIETYDLTNMVFKWIVNGIKLDKTQKERIYSVVFKEHITDEQINDIINLIIKDDDSIGKEFQEYIEKEYTKTFDTTDNFGYAYSVIKAYHFYSQGFDPMKKAEEMLLASNDFDAHIAMNILIIMSWCKCVNIKNLFRKYFLTFKPSRDAIKKLGNLALSIEGDRRPLAADTIQELSLGEYISSDDLIENIDITEIIALLTNSDLNTECSKVKTAETILSIYPILTEMQTDVCPQKIKTHFWNRFNEQLDSSIKDAKSNSYENLIFTFNICATIGCWKDRDEIESNFNKLKSIYERKSTETRFGALYRRIKKQFQHETDVRGISSHSVFPENPFSYYSKGDFEKAKELFIKEIKDQTTELSAYNNLGYMLRRHEITEVKIENELLSVDELFNRSYPRDAYVVLNKALLVSNIYCDNVGNYKDGLEYLKQYDTVSIRSLNSFSSAISFWESVAETGETEGFVVLEWLLELKIISTTKLGNYNQIYDILKERGVEMT